MGPFNRILSVTLISGLLSAGSQAQPAGPAAILVYSGATIPASGQISSYTTSGSSLALDKALAAAPPGSYISIPSGYRETARSTPVAILKPDITIDAAPGARITANAAIYVFHVEASSFHLNGLVIDGGGKGGCLNLGSGAIEDFQWTGHASGAGYSCQNTGPGYQGMTWMGILSNSTIDGVTFKNMREGGLIAAPASEYNLRIHNVTVDGTTNDNPLHFINNTGDRLACTTGLIIDGFRATNFWRIGMELQGSNWCGGNIVTNVVMSDLKPGAAGCISFSAGEEATGANPIPPGYHQLELVQHISCIDHSIWRGTARVAGASVTWLTGTQFNSNMTRITLGNSSYPVRSVADSTHITLAASAGSGTSIAFGYPNQLGTGIEMFGDNMNIGDFSISGNFCNGVAFGGKNANIHDGTLSGMTEGCGGGPNTGVGVVGNSQYDLSNATIERINCVENQQSCIIINGANPTIKDNTCSRTPGWHPGDSTSRVQCFIIANSLQNQIGGKAQVIGNRALITGLNATLQADITANATAFTIGTWPQLPPVPFTFLVDSEQITVNSVTVLGYLRAQVQYTVAVTRAANRTPASSHAAAVPLVLDATSGMTFSGFSSGIGGPATDAVWKDNVIANYTAGLFGTGFFYGGGPGNFTDQELSGNTYDHLAVGFSAASQSPAVHDNHCIGGTTDWTCDNQTYATYSKAPSPGGNGSHRYCSDCSSTTGNTCAGGGKGAEVFTIASELACVGKPAGGVGAR